MNQVYRLSMQKQNQQEALLWTDAEMDALAGLVDADLRDAEKLEGLLENEVARRKNYLRFVGGGIKLTRSSYAENPPKWWKVDQEILSRTRRQNERV